MTLHLFEHPLSSYAQKVKILLREKRLPFSVELPASFGAGPQADRFWAASPRGEVPALLDGEVALFDSTVICEYLEDRYPEPPMLPPDPAGRARARLVEEVCDTQYEAINWGWGEILWFGRATGELARSMRETATRQTRTMQRWLEAQLGDAPWFGGERFGWADAAAAPMVNRSVHYGIGPVPETNLARWHASLATRPSVAETFVEFDAAALRMAEAADHYRTGGRRREYRDHRLDWMIRSGGLSIIQEGLRDNNIRFSWPSGDEG